MLQGVIEARPDLPEALLELHDSYREDAWDAEAEAALLDTLALAPDRQELLQMAYAHYSSRGEMRSAIGYQERMLRTMGTPFSRRRAQALEDRGRLREAADELDALIRHDPYDLYLWKDRVRLGRALAVQPGQVVGARARCGLQAEDGQGLVAIVEGVPGGVRRVAGQRRADPPDAGQVQGRRRDG